MKKILLSLVLLISLFISSTGNTFARLCYVNKTQEIETNNEDYPEYVELSEKEEKMIETAKKNIDKITNKNILEKLGKMLVDILSNPVKYKEYNKTEDSRKMFKMIDLITLYVMDKINGDIDNYNNVLGIDLSKLKENFPALVMQKLRKGTYVREWAGSVSTEPDGDPLILGTDFVYNKEGDKFSFKSIKLEGQDLEDMKQAFKDASTQTKLSNDLLSRISEVTSVRTDRYWEMLKKDYNDDPLAYGLDILKDSKGNIKGYGYYNISGQDDPGYFDYRIVSLSENGTFVKIRISYFNYLINNKRDEAYTKKYLDILDNDKNVSLDNLDDYIYKDLIDENNNYKDKGFQDIISKLREAVKNF
ncbi:MAG: hypothetical protein N4A38_05150 [Candidatus Gracilibacteria bacterium]|nr:hypothetical protein [Candidatus Gracilibacteria bacterium]